MLYVLPPLLLLWASQTLGAGPANRLDDSSIGSLHRFPTYMNPSTYYSLQKIM